MGKRKNPEHELQCSVFEWIEDTGKIVFPELELAHSSTTGQPRYGWEISWYKKEGARTGYPDINIPVSRCGYSGLFIELKIPPNKLREDQAFRIFSLRKQGYACVVRYTKKDIINTILDYMLGNGVYDPDKIYEFSEWKPKKVKNGSRKQKPPSYRESSLYRHWRFTSG